MLKVGAQIMCARKALFGGVKGTDLAKMTRVSFSENTGGRPRGLAHPDLDLPEMRRHSLFLCMCFHPLFQQKKTIVFPPTSTMHSYILIHKLIMP